MKPGRTVFRISITLMSVMSLFFAAVVFAQMEKLQNTSPEQRAKIQTAFMKAKLRLTTQQMEQVGSINLKYAEQMDPVIKGEGRPRARMQQVKMIEQAKDGEMRSVLSPDQYGKYLASKEEMRKRVIEKAREKRAGAG